MTDKDAQWDGMMDRLKEAGKRQEAKFRDEEPIGESNPCVLNEYEPQQKIVWPKMDDVEINTIRPQGYPIGFLPLTPPSEDMADLHDAMEQSLAGQMVGTQDIFQEMLEANRKLYRAAKVEHLKAKYGQNFEPDFDDPKIIGRWIRKTEQNYRARWANEKWTYEKVGPAPHTVVISTLMVEEAG